MPQTLSSDTPDKGRLRIHVGLGPEPSCGKRQDPIFDTGQPEKLLEEIGTDTNGNSETVELPAPPIEYSMEPSETSLIRNILSRFRQMAEPFSISGGGAFRFSGPPGCKTFLRGLPATFRIQFPLIRSSAIIHQRSPGGESSQNNASVKSSWEPRGRSGIYCRSDTTFPQDSTAQDHYIRYSDYIKNVASARFTPPGRGPRSQRMCWR